MWRVVEDMVRQGVWKVNDTVNEDVVEETSWRESKHED